VCHHHVTFAQPTSHCFCLVSQFGRHLQESVVAFVWCAKLAGTCKRLLLLFCLSDPVDQPIMRDLKDCYLRDPAPTNQEVCYRQFLTQKQLNICECGSTCTIEALLECQQASSAIEMSVWLPGSEWLLIPTACVWHVLVGFDATACVSGWCTKGPGCHQALVSRGEHAAKCVLSNPPISGASIYSHASWAMIPRLHSLSCCASAQLL